MNVPSESANKPRPYALSWANHLTAWVEGRPWPNWVFYLGLWLVLVGVQIGSLWIEGVYPIGTIFPAQLFIPAMITLFLGMIHLLDSKAETALASLRPVLEATEDEYERLRYQLTTLPAWPTILTSLATVVIVYLLGLVSGEQESSLEALGASSVARNLLVAVFWIGWWVLGAFLYHTVHQLGVINRIYAEHTRVHLFAMSPLYAFSGVTALTAVTLVIATYGWTALNPENLSESISIVFIFLISILALVVFAWPLLGTRRLLAKEKAQWLDQISLRVESVFSEIHQRIDAGAWEETEELTKVLALLKNERDTLKSISTWPWSPDTLRLLITALGLPLLLWVIQYVLQLFLGS